MLNGQWEVTNAGTEKGTEEKGPINKSETASDGTSMGGTVRIRLFDKCKAVSNNQKEKNKDVSS